METKIVLLFGAIALISCSVIKHTPPSAPAAKVQSPSIRCLVLPDAVRFAERGSIVSIVTVGDSLYLEIYEENRGKLPLNYLWRIK